MSILIKGKEMPNHCGECPCAYSTEGAYWDTCQAVDDQNDIEQFWKSGRPDWCPLVEVPKHGRLIDADALTKTISENVYPVTDYFNSRDYGMFWTGGIEKAINEQPTIIEAEE